MLAGLFYLLFCGMFLAVGSLAGWIAQSDLLRALAVQGLLNKDPAEVFQQRQAVTILILGCDEDRYYGGKQILRTQARSDMMLVAKLDFENNRISGVSIPRDTLVRLPGYREQKINGYHAIGANQSPQHGKKLAKAAVETIVPVQIDRVLVIDYEAFQEMVDLVGGVEVFVPKRMKYTDVRGGLEMDLKPGRHLLDGYDAMCYVRYRKGDSDYERQQRQKDFLMAFKETIEKRPTLLNRAADKALAMVGGDLSADEMAALAIFAKRIGADNVRLGQVPTYEVANYNQRVDERKLPEVLREFHLLPDTAGTLSYRQ
jgi:polyisoprenyl-teichoic acid--peptidoglycan teichoic acid transferase